MHLSLSLKYNVRERSPVTRRFNQYGSIIPGFKFVPGYRWYVNINAFDIMGETVLHHVSLRNQGSILLKILERFSVNINAQDNYGKTPLHYAAINWNHECTNLLLTHENIKVNVQDNKGKTALHFSAENYDSESVKMLFTHTDIGVNIQDNDGRTPLHFAAICSSEETNSFIELLELLLSREDIEINIEDNEGTTPFQHAVERYSVPTIKRLLSCQDIDVNTVKSGYNDARSEGWKMSL